MSKVEQRRPHRRGLRGIVIGAVVALMIGLVALNMRGNTRTASTNLSPTDQVALGRQLYAVHCASCHGANLEGQPNWQQELPTGGRPAPPHDATGHTWHHNDQSLFTTVKFGGQLTAPVGYKSNMPAFRESLKDDEIWAVLAFIKSTWPPDIQAAQQQQGHQ